MSSPLPRWVKSNAESLAREAEPYRHLTAGERLAVLERVCRAAVDQARSRSDAAKVLAWRDPLPAETLKTLSQLRAGAKKQGQ